MSHPYRHLPDRNFWSRAVPNRNWQEIFFQEVGKFEILPTDKVASAGSCFAQRIALHLRSIGNNAVEFEPPHPFMQKSDADRLGYGRFSARYGNIYTVKQLRQLVDESFGREKFCPKIEASIDQIIYDLRRPNINEVGFSDIHEAMADRRYHLSRVRNMFLETDVFIFTMGLTEAWIDKSDGTVFGTHPAVVLKKSSKFDVRQVNYNFQDCFEDAKYIIEFIKDLNPRIKFIFTVSPVGLVATHQDRHVLISTNYSKSVLRAICGELSDIYTNVDYFPSYEIFSLAQSFGQYLSGDLRDVSPRGVSTTMQLFGQMYIPDSRHVTASPQVNLGTDMVTSLKHPGLAQIECDEILNQIFGE